MEAHRQGIKLNTTFFTAMALYYAIYCLFVSFMVVYLTKSGYSASFCGILNTATYIVSLLIQPAVGYIADTYFSLKKCMLFFAFMSGAAIFLVPAFIHDRNFCFLSILFVSVFVVPFMSLLDTWAVSAHTFNSSLNYSLVRAGGSIGFGITSFLAGYLIEKTGFYSMFIAQFILSMSIFVIMLLLPDIPADNKKKTESAVSRQSLSLKQSFIIILSKPEYRFASAVIFLYWLTHRPIGLYLSIMVEGLGGNTVTFGKIAGLGGFAEALIPLFAYGFLHRTSLKKLLGICLLVNLIRPLALVFANQTGPNLLAAAQILQSLGFSIYYVAGIECFNRTAPAQIRSTAITLGLSITAGAGTMLANLIGGVLIDWFGTAAVIRFSLSCAFLDLFLFCMFIGRYKVFDDEIC